MPAATATTTRNPRVPDELFIATRSAKSDGPDMGLSGEISRSTDPVLVWVSTPLGRTTGVSLRGAPVEQEVALPDGRVVAVRVGLAEDSYIPRREVDTVVLELWDEGRGEHLAGVSTVLSVDDVAAARGLLREVVEGLADGSLEHTAGALEPLADSVPDQ